MCVLVCVYNCYWQGSYYTMSHVHSVFRTQRDLVIAHGSVQILSPQCHFSHYIISVVTRGNTFYILTTFSFFLFLNKSVMKSGSVAIKGQFTVQKAALEDLSQHKNVERGIEFSPTFFFFFLNHLITQQRVFSAPEAQRRVCMG